MKQPADSRQAPSERTVLIEEAGLRRFKGGFTAFPNRVLRNRQLGMGAKLVYVMLLSYAWQEEFCRPAQETLASDLGASDRSIRIWLNELRAAGLITWVRRGLNRTNRYRILKLPSAEETPADAKPERQEESSAPDRNGKDFRSRTESDSDQERKELPGKNTHNKNTQHTQRVSNLGSDDPGSELVAAFHERLRHSRARKPAPKELDQARQMIAEDGLDAARFILDFAIAEAAETGFQMKHFGAVISYRDEALEAFAARARGRAAKLQRAQEDALHQEYEGWRERELARLRSELSPEALQALEAQGRSSWPSRFRMPNGYLNAAVNRALVTQHALPAFDEWLAARPERTASRP